MKKIKQILCILEFHNWEKNVFLPVANDVEILCREYDQCRWCGKFSWIKHFRKFDLSKERK